MTLKVAWGICGCEVLDTLGYDTYSSVEGFGCKEMGNLSGLGIMILCVCAWAVGYDYG